jgi:hypothetical protein
MMDARVETAANPKPRPGPCVSALDVIIYASLQAFAIYRSSVFSLAVYGRFSKVRNLNMAVMVLLFLSSTVRTDHLKTSKTHRF